MALLIFIRYEPPVLDKEHSNSENSQNTALFLVSCYQYILSAIVLSVGKPFRQSMSHNCKPYMYHFQSALANILPVPFVVTMVVALAISSYMLFDPADWLFDLMELTWMSFSFRGFIVALAVGGFSISYAAERILFPRLAKFIGVARTRLRPEHQKKRKEYKVVLEGMRV